MFTKSELKESEILCKIAYPEPDLEKVKDARASKNQGRARRSRPPAGPFGKAG